MKNTTEFLAIFAAFMRDEYNSLAVDIQRDIDRNAPGPRMRESMIEMRDNALRSAAKYEAKAVRQ